MQTADDLIISRLDEGAAEHETLKDHARNPFHKVLAQHGFEHLRTEHKENRLAPKTPEGKHDYTEHVYKHPAHGKSHVIITQYHNRTRLRKSDKADNWLFRHEQSNGIMAPTAGDTKPQLHRALSREYGEPK